MNLFEYIYPRFYFDKDKPIRLFEAFSGIGCQAMALKRITSNFELVGFSEIDKPAIQSYKAQQSGMSNSQLYKQAGNGIVVNVFEAILRNLFKE